MMLRVIAALVMAAAGAAIGQVGTAFTYQGKLTSDGSPATAPVDVRFRLYDSATGGAAVGPLLETPGVAPEGGVFSTVLDFGSGRFTQPRWIEISVAAAGSGAFTVLSPRQAVMPAPQAQFAQTAMSYGGSNLSIAGQIQASAFVFGDGSVQTEAALDPGKTGALSGLGAAASYRVIIGGQTATGVTLAGPITMEVPLDVNGIPSGSSTVTSMLKLRRSAAIGTIWGTGFNNNQAFGQVSIELAQNGTPGAGPRVTWEFGSTRSVAWRVTVGDDGGPVEEVTLWFDRSMLRRTQSGALAPAGLPDAGARRGADAGSLSLFRMSLAGSLGTGSVVSQDLVQTAPFDAVTGTRTGRVTTPTFTVRANAACNNATGIWNMWRTGGQTSLDVLAWTPGGQVSVLAANNARACGWSLVPTDDGKLVEDLKVTVPSVN